MKIIFYSENAEKAQIRFMESIKARGIKHLRTQACRDLVLSENFGDTEQVYKQLSKELKGAQLAELAMALFFLSWDRYERHQMVLSDLYCKLWHDIEPKALCLDDDIVRQYCLFVG